MRRLVLFPFLLVATAPCACSRASGGPGQRVVGRPVETLAPNGENQTPAFPGQTRAPFATANVVVNVRSVARGLEHPWSAAFLDGGRFLVTERPGRLRIVSPDGSKSAPLAGVPAVDARGQGGLLDVALAPDFATSGLVYLTFSEPREGGNGTALARARLRTDGTPRLEETRTIWRQMPTIDSKNHFGSRIVFAPDGNLFVTLGERYDPDTRKQAQELGSALGKIVRLTPEGAPAPGNPFAGRPGALPEIWSMGHRNIQAAALHPVTKELWEVEHGARGGDEINVARAGKDYGWPTITYGIDYSGRPIGAGITRKEGMEQPLYYWDPSIAPSGMAFYEGPLFPAWKGNLLVGALAGKHVARLVLDGEKVVSEERLLTDHGRIRDVRVGPTGAVWVLTDEDDGELLELTPGR